MTARRIAGATLATAGAVGTTASAYMDWVNERAPWSKPQDMPFSSLYESSLAETSSSYWTSVAIPLAVVTLLAVLGAILRSRIVLTVGFLLGLATVALWVIMRLLDDETEFSFGDLESGFWVSLLGLAVMLIGISSMGKGEAKEPEAGVEESTGGFGSDLSDISDLPDLGDTRR